MLYAYLVYVRIRWTAALPTYYLTYVPAWACTVPTTFRLHLKIWKIRRRPNSHLNCLSPSTATPTVIIISSLHSSTAVNPWLTQAGADRTEEMSETYLHRPLLLLLTRRRRSIALYFNYYHVSVSFSFAACTALGFRAYLLTYLLTYLDHTWINIDRVSAVKTNENYD